MMTVIFPPTDERDPAYWSAVWAGHIWVGMVSAALVVWLGWPATAAPVMYLAVWELAYQRAGAGLRDALTDTAAVAIGAGTIWASWHGLPGPLALSFVAGILGAAVGIWRRV